MLFKVEIYELSVGGHRIPFSLKCRFLHHSSPCMGYRFELEGEIITNCLDIDLGENAITLAKNADILIAECSFKRGQTNTEWLHLNPENAAQIVKEANAKKLALLHFDANIYKTLQEREKVEEAAREIFCKTHVAVDNSTIKI